MAFSSPAGAGIRRDDKNRAGLLAQCWQAQAGGHTPAAPRPAPPIYSGSRGPSKRVPPRWSEAGQRPRVALRQNRRSIACAPLPRTPLARPSGAVSVCASHRISARARRPPRRAAPRSPPAAAGCRRRCSSSILPSLSPSPWPSTMSSTRAPRSSWATSTSSGAPAWALCPRRCGRRAARVGVAATAGRRRETARLPRRRRAGPQACVRRRAVALLFRRCAARAAPRRRSH
jgi:hypothetical protein